MAHIKEIIENVDGVETKMYPVTSTKAVYNENNEKLDDILVFPDEEDITIDLDNKLKLKDKIFSVELYNGLGRTYLRKNIVDGRNTLTNSMITSSNMRYVIQYDYDLNGKTITIPQNCILDFQGGSFTNGSIIGNNTQINASENIQIFNIDRDYYYIGGTWNINKWCCAWFGTVNDGKAYRATYDSSGNLIKSTNGHEVIIEGTDNFEPIQEALDAAYNTNVRVVELGLGVYRIAKPLNIGWGGYQSINFNGIKSGHFGDIAEGIKEATIILCDTGTYGICINSGHCVKLSNFDILGWNGINYRKNFTGWQNTTFYVENPEDWNSERVNKLPFYGLDPMSPYAGIVTDAFIAYDSATNPYELPKPPVNISNFNPQNSTGLTVERVKSSGFCVGFGLEVGNYSDNADFYKFYNCDFNNNVYGFSTGSNQARNTALHECNLSRCYIAISNNKVGKKNGGLYGYISNCWFDFCYKILEYKPDISPVTFYNCYCENSYMIGGSDNISTIIPNNIKFIDCNLKFTSSLNNPLGIPSYYFYGNCQLIRTNITVKYDGILVPLFIEGGIIEDCEIRSISNFDNTKDCIFLPCLTKKLKVSQSPLNNSSYNRLKEYCNSVGDSASNIIQVKNLNSPKQLKHTSYSYNEDDRILTLETDWIGSTISYEKTICVGDIIMQKYNLTTYVIVKITPSEDKNTATILCTPIQGFRKKDNKYILRGKIVENTLWSVFSTRFMAFSSPLIVKEVNGKELTLKTWNNDLKEGIVLSKVHDYFNSFKYESGVVEAVDSSTKKLTLKYSNGIDDTFKVINGYMIAEEDIYFWKGSWVQEFIDNYNPQS